jgi:hypothetical protein
MVMVSYSQAIARVFAENEKVLSAMAVKEWIKTASQRIREAVEQALPAPQPERVPIRIPVSVGPPRPQRRYY